MADGSENEDLFLEPLPDYLRCPVCLCCLTNPYQTPCGHRFCKDCILPIMSSRNAVCPVDRTPVDATNTFPDNAAKLQINSLKVHCLNEGCDWKGDYNDYSIHLGKCVYSLITCELCGNQIRQSEQEAHNTVCPRRKVRCEYCQVEVPFSDQKNHYRLCTEFPVSCSFKCSSGPIPRRALKDHHKECPAFLVSCSMAPFGCTEQVKRSDLPEHVLQCGPKYAAKMGQLILDLQQQVTQLSLKVEEQNKTTAILDSTLYPCSGQFTWRIDKIRRKIQAAEVGESEAAVIYSPAFYSCESGYKICLCVYPAGDNNQGFLSLYFVLMKGQFDEVLPWPFQKRVMLSLLTCSTSVRGQPLIKDIHPDPRLHYFSRPESPQNIGYGYPKFIALPRLLNEDSDFVENGAIFIRAIVFQ